MEIIIRENDSLPIYEQIVREVKKAIIKKEIMPGDMMPSIRALARELEISVITTKRAYEELEKEQLIYSVPGKGFYVKERNRELLKEDQIRQIEEKMMDAVQQAKGDGSVSSGAEKNVGNVLCGRAIVCLEYYNVSMWRGRIRDLH